MTSLNRWSVLLRVYLFLCGRLNLSFLHCFIWPISFVTFLPFCSCLYIPTCLGTFYSVFSFCVLFQAVFCTVCDIGRPCSWLCPAGMFAIPVLSLMLIRKKQLHMGLIQPQYDLHFKESFFCFFKLQRISVQIPQGNSTVMESPQVYISLHKFS